MLKKTLIILMLLVFSITGAFAATSKKSKSPYKTKIIEVETKDTLVVKAKLMYKKPLKNEKGVTYPTVVLLHSLGYSSSHWGSLPEQLLKQGYAVLLVDLRGHGMSNKDVKFKLHSWTYFTPKTYKKIPNDVIAIINQTKKVGKKASFNNYSIVGGDIGANAAILVADKMYPKPKSLVLLTPAVDYKGLTVASLNGPVPISQVGSGKILCMCSKNDKYSVNQEMLLKKFTHTGQFIISNVSTNKNGMLIVRNDQAATKVVIDFLNSNMMPEKK